MGEKGKAKPSKKCEAVYIDTEIKNQYNCDLESGHYGMHSALEIEHGTDPHTLESVRRRIVLKWDDWTTGGIER